MCIKTQSRFNFTNESKKGAYLRKMEKPFGSRFDEIKTQRRTCPNCLAVMEWNNLYDCWLCKLCGYSEK